MKIVFICKRYYTGKDVIRHRFGRLHEFPVQLAQLGHQVTVICLDYRNDDPQKNTTEAFGSGSVSWFVCCARHLFNLEFFSIYRSIKIEVPDVIIGASDIPCLWLARTLAWRFGVAYAVDLYDNYESFGQARIPGFRHVLKHCIKNAHTVIAVSAVLKDKVQNDYLPSGSVVVMSNGISKSSFFAGEPETVRHALGLPTGSRLIGTAGNLTKMKGLDTVYDAWGIIEGLSDNVYLVLAGHVDARLPIPSSARVIYLGEIAEEQVSQLFRALDVGIIPAHDSEFGRYCFPQKLYEMVACKLPVVAAKVGAIADTLQMHPEMLFLPGDTDSLVSTILFQLENRLLANIELMEWGGLIKNIEPLILGSAAK